MSTPAITLGSVWRRKAPLDDGYDEVRVVGSVFCGEQEPNDWTIEPAREFGAPLQTSSAGLVEFCELVEAGPPPGAAWEL
jgi:hypothetical protein